jgi:pimeloyl-ACP methyl ester carboxylesterase
MSDDPAGRSLSVGGGTTGVAADSAEIRELARSFGDAAHDDLGQLVQLHRYLAEPAVLASAALDPPGAAAFEAELLLALDGPFGLAACAAATGIADGELRFAANSYESAEATLDPYINDLKASVKLPRALWHAGSDLVHGKPGQLRGDLLTYDPALLDAIPSGIRRPLLMGAETLLIDGKPRTLSLGQDGSPAATRAPANLTDVLRGIALRDEGRDGEIDVRIIETPAGTRAVIVDITGTKSQTPLPFNHDAADLGSGAAALQGHDTTYEQGVLEALNKAGVRPGDPVMLVGHSLGGMVAVNLARDAVRSKRYNVTHVVTAGAPIGSTVADVPGSVNVLALENARDIVPHLDGVTNPDRANVTTVSGEYGDHTIGGAHSLPKAYVSMAQDVDASNNQAVRDYLASAGTFFSGTSVRTKTYVIQRRFDPLDSAAEMALGSAS